MAFLKYYVRPKKIGKLETFVQRADLNIKAWLKELSEVWKKETQQNLSGSVTGIYPARRTGYLHSRVLPKQAKITKGASGGEASVPYVVTLEVDCVYASIHEVGGQAGRNRSVTIPARPYAEPALNKTVKQMVKRFREFIFKGVK